MACAGLGIEWLQCSTLTCHTWPVAPLPELHCAHPSIPTLPSFHPLRPAACTAARTSRTASQPLLTSRPMCATS